MKKPVTLSILAIALFTGCASSSKLARELAKDKNTVSFSIQLVTPWGQQNVSLARTGAGETNSVNSAGGAASINK